MKCNLQMMNEISNICLTGLHLPDELQLWVDKGFIEEDGCVFLSALFNGNPGTGKLVDRTGVECFVNSFHIEDFITERYLDYSCLFCNHLLKRWYENDLNEKKELNVIIMLDEFGAVIKFHLKRENEHWLGSDLEKYEEAILETTKPF
ncbi:hypothetical protein RJ498_001861 [Pluralibacter gergoviae]